MLWPCGYVECVLGSRPDYLRATPPPWGGNRDMQVPVHGASRRSIILTHTDHFVCFELVACNDVIRGR